MSHSSIGAKGCRAFAVNCHLPHGRLMIGLTLLKKFAYENNQTRRASDCLVEDLQRKGRFFETNWAPGVLAAIKSGELREVGNNLRCVNLQN
ncbi:hypothetical protein [Noviherbaspirillum humi]|uniref:hypothetical protein n=1 Tax=Noviherbaspirillum humi TaxID=1688639 RepID=UPI001160D6E7|nr:hypothetical protein [Noviherbaspirillum humi]